MSLTTARAYLLAYDIKDPRRLQRVHKLMTEEGLAVQYSVFAGAWSESDLKRLAERMRDRLEWTEDDVRVYPIPERCSAIVLGRAMTPDGVGIPNFGLDLFRALGNGATQELMKRRRFIQMGEQTKGSGV